MPARTLLRLAALALFTAAPLAQAQAPAGAERIARAHLADRAKAFGADAADFDRAEVTDAYTSRHTGVTHVYLRQQLAGLPVFNGLASAHVLPSGDILTAHAAFGRVDTPPAPPALAARAAVEALARDRGASLPAGLQEEANPRGRGVVFADASAGFAPEAGSLPTQAERGYYVLADGTVRPAWQVTLPDDGTAALEDDHLWVGFVDGATGEVLAAHDLVIHETAAMAVPLAPQTRRTLTPVDLTASAAAAAPFAVPTYRVFALPLESPTDGNRSRVSDPAFLPASPLGWHDDGATSYTITRGNNVFAFIDADVSAGQEDEPDTDPDAIPDGGAALTFDFPLNLNQAPSSYRLASTTNLFYWSNVVHDIAYVYGFDEAAGNFQVTNLTSLGRGGDAVRAQGQSGAGTNNANFRTPPDGFEPRMRMYIGTSPTPDVDGSFDNQVVVHEYGHGISTRLTGGPSTAICLGNSEQAGEGWSDWFGTALTIEPGDTGTTRRPVGTYLFGLDPATSNGIRPAPYSTDLAVNPATYGFLTRYPATDSPHRTGYVFASVLWDLTWALIDKYGYNPDYYETDPALWGGNNYAFQLIMDGLKLQPCSPDQLASRDAILAADRALTGGDNQRLLWEVFARRGYGASAVAGSSSRGDEREAFDIPLELQQILKAFKELDADPAVSGSFLTVQLDVVNDTEGPLTGIVVTDTLGAGLEYIAGSSTGAAQLDGDAVVFAPFDLAQGERRVLEYTTRVVADGGEDLLFSDDMEEANSAWLTGSPQGANAWQRSTIDARSGSTSWYVDEPETPSEQTLTLLMTATASESTVFEFYHRYNTEPGFDGGVVEVSTDFGSTWAPAESFLENGYNSVISGATDSALRSRAAFSGASNGFVRSRLGLSAYAGQDVIVRFRFATDSGNAGLDPTQTPPYGWFVDDVRFFDDSAVVVEGCAEAAQGDQFCTDAVVSVATDPGGTAQAAASTTQLSAIVGLDDQPTATQTFTLDNAGDRELAVVFTGESGAPLPTWLSFDARSARVDASGSLQVTAQFDGTGLTAGQTYTARVVAVTNAPATPAITFDVTLEVKQSVPTEGGPVVLEGTHLLGAVYPNPVRRTAQIELAVREAQAVRVEVYDVTGRRVALLHEGELAAGTLYGFTFEADGLASGTYVLRASGRDFAEVRRLTVVQ